MRRRRLDGNDRGFAATATEDPAASSKPHDAEQVAVESARRGGVDYEGIWQQVLANSAADRATELRELVDRWSGLRRS